MQLSSLHAFVVVSYCLATFGMDGEDLFGSIFCLVVMLQATVMSKEVGVSVKE